MRNPSTNFVGCLVKEYSNRVTFPAANHTRFRWFGAINETPRGVTVVGFSKKKKTPGAYYPLFCTVAQTGQMLNMSLDHHVSYFESQWKPKS
jgi:hypothetical protein